MVSEGARSPAVTAAAKKEPPSAKHERVCVFEHGRPRNFIGRCYVLALQTHTGSRAKSPRAPVFRLIVSENAVRGITSHRPPNDIALKRRNRAKAPPPAPSPRTPHSARDISQKRARGAGAGTPGTPQPRARGHPAPPGHPLYCTNNNVLTEPEALVRINTQAHHAGPLGAADFPCLRQLPPPPFKR